MYSIILVDDERSLRESVERLVEWEDNGFRLMGTAENGLDALQLMQKKGIPDVVITDIKMPVMDGIELAKHLREEYPTTKIVFLSGYDEFQYALAGIKLNVVSYLLKPISKKELEDCLRNLRKQLDEEKLAVTDEQRISREYFKNLEMMRFSFLTSLLTENHQLLPPNELDSFLKMHNLEFLKQNKILFTIQLASPQDQNAQENNREFRQFSLFKVIREIIQKYGMGDVILFSSYVICIVTGTEAELNENKEIITRDILETTHKLLNQMVHIGVSEQYTDIFQTKRAFRSSLTALDYTNSGEHGKAVFIDDIEKHPTQTIHFDELNENELVLALKTNNEEVLKELLNDYLTNTQHPKEARPSILRTFISVVYVTSMRALRETIGEFENKYNIWYHQIFEAAQYEKTENIYQELLEFCTDVMHTIQDNRLAQTNSLVSESLKYLEENYKHPEMSLKFMSNYLNVTPSYFSSIFKKETGKSFIDTLTEMKMNQAKDLVLTTDYKMYEIASECGYEDQHYFSYSFKKHFGVSPTKMRNEMNEPQKI